jgi:tetratricopeptide (TPR) repeat protein
MSTLSPNSPRPSGSEHYNMAVIRNLLRDALTAEELRRFCQDRPAFRPVLVHFGPGFSFADMIDVVLEYCQTLALFPQLLSDIQTLSPRQYERYRRQIHDEDATTEAVVEFPSRLRRTLYGGPSAWWGQLRQRPLVFYPVLAFTILIGISLLIVGLAHIDSFIEQLQAWRVLPTSIPTATPLAFAVAREDEVLVIVFTFRHTSASEDTDAQGKIYDAILAQAQKSQLDNFRVEIEPAQLAARESEEAERLGEQYNASMIIWGEDTGVEIAVNFRNLKEPGFMASEVAIRENERVRQASDMDRRPWIRFMTEDLPTQLAFLSLFSVGQAYYYEGDYRESIEVIEQAVASLPSDMDPMEEVADAYFQLGKLYRADGTNQQALIAYTQAITYEEAYQARLDTPLAEERKKEYAKSYNNRGNVRRALGDLPGAIEDFEEAIRLDPTLAVPHSNLGNVYYDLGDLSRALEEYKQAIALDANYVTPYVGRGMVRAAQGELLDAISDYGEAIARDPGYPYAYRERGKAHRAMGSVELALTDLRRYLELRPNAEDRQTVEEWIAELEAKRSAP